MFKLKKYCGVPTLTVPLSNGRTAELSPGMAFYQSLLPWKHTNCGMETTS